MAKGSNIIRQPEKGKKAIFYSFPKLLLLAEGKAEIVKLMWHM